MSYLADTADDETRASLAEREEEALKIDPETAEYTWRYGQVLDPYGVVGVGENDCVGRNHFYRNPGSDIWVWDGDIPADILERLRARPASKARIAYLRRRIAECQKEIERIEAGGSWNEDDDWP